MIDESNPLQIPPAQYGLMRAPSGENDSEFTGSKSENIRLEVREGNLNPIRHVTELDFDASDFNIVDGADGSASISLAYSISANTPAEGSHGHYNIRHIWVPVESMGIGGTATRGTYGTTTDWASVIAMPDGSTSNAFFSVLIDPVFSGSPVSSAGIDIIWYYVVNYSGADLNVYMDENVIGLAPNAAASIVSVGGTTTSGPKSTLNGQNACIATMSIGPGFSITDLDSNTWVRINLRRQGAIITDTLTVNFDLVGCDVLITATP